MTHPLKICIVTSDIVGPIRNGGIGTAYYNLAIALARDGQQVTVLYALGQHCEKHTVAYWVRAYAKAGIEFVPLPSREVFGHSAIKISYAIYGYLKERSFDIVHYHEWRGLGFYSALAKRQGLALQDTVLVAGTHSPTMWQNEGMEHIADAEQVEVDFMERESVALADVLWSPSQHMVEWLRREGWTLPKDVLLLQYIVLDLKSRTGRGASTSPELVFFGRLETRKGLDVFCDALDRLCARGVPPKAVTFLGKLATVGGTPSAEYLEQRARKWTFRWKIISDRDRDGAMAYLRAGNRVAVLPSRMDNLPYTVLECLGSGIPFVASTVGGIPEMVRPRDQKRVLFDLTAPAMADRLADVLKRGLPATPMRIPESRTLAQWTAWHRRIGRTGVKTRRPRRATPLVTVCITHRNRPAYLEASLESIRQQDYRNFEVVVVDDGSDLPEATAYLTKLRKEFSARGWRIVRQANRYPGAARNAGVRAARGEFIMFMDDDNLARPHEISTFVRAAQHSGATILTCFSDVFQSTEPQPGEHRNIHTWPFLGGALVPGVLRNVFGDANALIHRDVFARVGGFTEDYGVGAEDWEFFARAVLYGERLEVVPEPLMRYRKLPTGVDQSTSSHANHMRALRAYFESLPPRFRPFVHLAQAHMAGHHAPAADPVQAARLDHVRRVVVFGTGEGGKMAIDLARKCGWTVSWLVDNNAAMWDTTALGHPVKHPDSLKRRPVDLVIVASLAGKRAISAQLGKMGLTEGADYVHFLDPVRVGSTTLRMSLP